MTKILTVLLLLVIIFLGNGTNVFAWDSYLLPNVIAGGGAGYFRISLDQFDQLYRSRWSPVFSGQINVRVYRNYFLTAQYAKYINNKNKESAVDPNTASGNARWEERFINAGVRFYSEAAGKWNFYYTLGLTFISVTEKPGLSVFENTSAENTDGSGFFFELGSDFNLLPHVNLFLEFEITSAGAGGTPGFVGHSLGGYAFQSGLNFYF